MRRRRLLVLAGAVLLACAGMLWVLFGPLPAAPLSRLPAGSTVYLDRNGAILYQAPADGKTLRLWTSLRDLAPDLRAATVATEDKHFYGRPIGIDPLALLRTAWQDLRAGGIVAGGSTIDEQLARQLYLPPAQRHSRNPLRKLQEWVWALRLGRRYSHDRVLELYLNAVDYGEGATGAQAAAQLLFGHTARDLDLAESALLAGLVQSPERYDPLLHPQAALARRSEVLTLMQRRGSISQAQALSAANEPLQLTAVQHPLLAPHFVAMVTQQLQEKLGAQRVAAGGLTVRTALDLGLQRAAELSVAHQLDQLKDHDVGDAAVVALDPHTGEIEALVGSANYFDPAHGGNVNAALAERQPGSAIKPVIYAAALGAGMTPASELDDIHQSFPNGEGDAFAPEDYDTTFHGPVPLRVALASSLNVPAVEALDRTGRDTMLQVAARLGLADLGASNARLSLALGGGEVRLLDLTSAYAAFDDAGRWRPAVAIRSVEDAAGTVLLRGQRAAPIQAVSPQVAYLLTDILSDDDARALGFGYHSVLALDYPAAVKTGTTSDFHDNWTVGYTPDLVVGVWTGNADGHPMRDISGVSGAAPIWHELLDRALAGRSHPAFTRPEGIVTATACAPTGLLPGPDCPHPTQELFVAGSEPYVQENYFHALSICAVTNLVADAGCGGTVVRRVYPFPRPELVPWMQQAGIALPPVPPYLDFTAAGAGAGGVGAAPAWIASQPPNAASSGSTASQLPSMAATPGPVASRQPNAAIRIVSPDEGAVFHLSAELPAANQALPLQAVAGVANVASVVFSIDGVEFGSANAAPYGLTWPLSAGQHTLRATARDAAGAELGAQEVHFTVLPR